MKLRKQKKQMYNTKQRNLIAHLNPKSPVSEQFRTIRTNINFASAGESVHTMLVTSTGPSEGKSTVVANTCVVLAQQGKRVLLVDADMRKPTVHYTFRLGNTIGLTSVLTKDAKFFDAVRETDVENLYIMPSGPIPPNPSELLDSPSMATLLKEARDYFDVVIFDTPPVIAVTDATVLGDLVDGTILVVRSGQTNKEQAVKAKERLTQAKGKLLGVVLNDVEVKGNSDYYYYYGKS